MVTVTVDLDPNIVYAIRERAMHAGMSFNEAMADALRPMLGSRSRMPRLRILDEIEARVNRGECDADIGLALGYTVGRVGELRRKLGLKPNKRVW